MQSSRMVWSIAKLCFLLLIGVGIYRFWKQSPPQEIVDDAAEDLIEEHGDTYVPVHSGVIERKMVRRFVNGYGTVDAAHSARLVVNVALPAAQLAQVKVGQPATIYRNSASRVILVNATVDSGMGLVTVEMPSGSNWPEGKLVPVEIEVEHHANVLTVPARSIFTDTGGQTGVAVIDPSGRWAILMPVEVGLRENDTVEITGSGLDAGQAIVIEGTYGLLPRTRIHLLKD